MKIDENGCILACTDPEGGGGGGGGGGGSGPTLENHKLLFGTFEILLQTSLEKQLSNCFSKEVWTAICEIC